MKGFGPHPAGYSFTAKASAKWGFTWKLAVSSSASVAPFWVRVTVPLGSPVGYRSVVTLSGAVLGSKLR